jgi:trimeric autotransporter adhesin
MSENSLNPMPTITAISPSSVVAGAGATSLHITGTGFVSSSSATWNGSALTTKYVSGTEVDATVPASDLAGSSASKVSIDNPAPGGGTATAVVFDVNSPMPVITRISPQYVSPGSAETITITGTGFESNSSVLWNGSARSTTAVSATELKVTLSASDMQKQGIGSLAVSNPAPDASLSSSASLTVTFLPKIQSVTIANAIGFLSGCGQLQVTVTGQNFDFGATIQANGVSLQNIQSATDGSLVGFLPVGFASAPGALSFTVTNGTVVSSSFPYPSSPPAFELCVTVSNDRISRQWFYYSRATQ